MTRSLDRYNASSSSASIDVRVALWTYDMTIDTSDAVAVANSSTANVTADGTPYVTRKTLPDSWNATAQIHAAMATTVKPSFTSKRTSADTNITGWEVEGDR